MDGKKPITDTAKRSIRPSFLHPQAEKAARSASASASLRSREDTMAESKAETNGQSAQEAEEAVGFQSHVLGTKKDKGNGKVKGKFSMKKLAPLFVLLGILGSGTGFLFLAAPLLLPKFIDTNIISKVYSIAPTVTDWVIYTFGEQLSGGKIPKGFLESLQKSGISVGRLASSGQFSALLEEKEDALIAATSLVAANGTDDDMGFPLSIEYKGTVYSADGMVNAMHSNAELYNAFKQAIGGTDAILHSRIADDAYKTLGIDNSVYDNFSLTGNGEADQTAFEELFAKTLLTTVGTDIGGVEARGADGDAPQDTSAASVDSFTSSDEALQAAREYITKVAQNTTGKTVDEATLLAAAKLNAAISANESYQSARMYHSLVYPIRLSLEDKGGAINQVMNMLTETKTSRMIDPSTGKSVEMTGPAIQANALVSAIGDQPFSAADGAGYSRDRILTMADIQNMANANSGSGLYDAINQTVVSIGSILESIRNFISSLIFGTVRANVSVLVAAFTPSISQALFERTTDSMVGLAMGTRMIEGAAFFNAKLAQNVGGAMASDAAALTLYDRRNQEILAWDAEADRTSRNPFDISSPNTFLGSIVSKLAVTGASSTGIFSNILSTLSSMVGSVSSLLPGAYAAADNSYHMTLGNCSTENSIGGQGDMFCNQNPAFDYSTISLTMEDYKSILGDNLNADGSINQKSNFAEYVILGSERESTPGVKDANICAALNNDDSFFTKALHFLFGDALQLNDSCTGKDEDIATGREYLYSASNPYWDCGYKYFQGYMIKTYALELMGYYEEKGTQNPTVALKADYYKAHPKDNSYTGILARRSGMLKEDVIAGIKAMNYLAYLANYDPSGRYAFAEEEPEAEVTFEEEAHNEYVSFAPEPSYIVYSDLRSRTKIA